MKISAHLQSSRDRHEVRMRTDGSSKVLSIPPKASGYGSSVSGGELLFLALATCYCNDLYREAARKGIEITEIEVTVDGQFGKEGEPASHVTYGARVSARAPEEEIRALMKHTDTVAEIQNTLRAGLAVRLDHIAVAES